MHRSYEARRRLRVLLLATTCLAPAMPALAQYTTPQTTNAAGAEAVTFQGSTFVNQGLVGAGRVPAASRDQLGDTLGSLSSMAIVQSTWRRNGDSYSGTLIGLPDRGYNTDDLKADYPGRLSIFSLNFTPYTGTANLPAGTQSQTQLELAYQSSVVLRDFIGQQTTGLDPGADTASQGGVGPLPIASKGKGAGKLSIDAEGLVFLSDGSFYVSDEYAAGVYYFDPKGNLKGVILPPAALLPRSATGAVDYNSNGAPKTGRRNNQGLEGVTVTPDGKYLVTLLQSATVQDTDGSKQQTRTNTRLMVYDIQQTRTPTTPIAHYALQLPSYTLAGNGNANDRTAAQSEILALNDKQFLVLSRDGNGLGVGTTNPIVFKNIMLVDTTGATNLAGTPYETGTTPISPAGQLQPTITPVAQSLFVNMVNPTQLARLGMNTNTNPASAATMSEKWEALGIAPVLRENKPQDYFLFVGNDNDFLTRSGQMAGGLVDANGNPVGTAYDAGLENDNVVLVYQLTLPTYVNPVYYEAMVRQAPALQTSFVDTTKRVARFNEASIFAQQSQSRHGRRRAEDVRLAPQAGRLGPWVIGDYAFVQTDRDVGGGRASQSLRTTGVAVGADYAIAPGFSVGAAVSYVTGDAKAGYGSEYDPSAVGLSLYGSYEVGGFFVDAAYTYGFQKFDKVRRPDPYGLTGRGDFDGTSHTVSAQVGYNFVSGRLVMGPVGGLSYVRGDFDGYTESGAAGGNIRYPGGNFDSLVGKAGWQISYELRDRDFYFVPFGEIAYEHEFLNKGTTSSFGLASAQSSLGTVAIGLPSQNQNAIAFTVGAQGVFDETVTVGAAYTFKTGDDGFTSHAVTGRVGIRF
ncbi:MAG: autotransporter domain-containing protein [Alphaproteobacteria bacterium]